MVTPLMTQTLPTIIGMGVVSRTVEQVFKRNGRPVGTTHYHYKGKKVVSHRHEGGHLAHYHKGLRGYGRTRKTLRR